MVNFILKWWKSRRKDEVVAIPSEKGKQQISTIQPEMPSFRFFPQKDNPFKDNNTKCSYRLNETKE